jgi:CheY-like chemotaxis protein
MSGRRTVLLVEDDADLLRFASVTLRLAGYRLRMATDGQEAIALAHRARPDLVLLDLRLPRVDGWQVLEALRGDQALRQVPVVVLTADADPPQRERARVAGAVDYLVKPVSADALLAAVERALSPPEPGS